MKKNLVLLMMLFSLFVVSGCGGNPFDKDFVDRTDEVIAWEGEPIEVTFRVPSGIISGALPPLIEEFNKIYPQIKIEVDAVSGGYTDLRRLTILDIQSNIAPVMVIGYPDHFAEYYSGRALVNLQYLIDGKNGMTQEELDDFIPSYLNEGRSFDGTDDLFAFPFNKSTEVLVYNKTIMDALNALDATIVVPQTWQELQVIAPKINNLVMQGKVDNVIPIGEGEKTPSQYWNDGVFIPFSYDSASNAFITMTRQWGGAYTEKVNNEKGIVKFDNDEVKAGLTYFQNESIARRYALAESFGANYASDAFKQLKVFMTVGSSAGVGYNIPEGNKFEVGVTTVPYNANNPDGKFIIQQGTNLAILGQSTNLQRSAAWLFIRFLMQPENTAEFAMATGGYFPVKSSAYDLDIYKDYLANPPIDKINHSKAANVSLNYLNMGYRYFVDPAFVGSSQIREEVGRAYTAIIVNKRNIQDRINDAYNILGSAYR